MKYRMAYDYFRLPAVLVLLLVLAVSCKKDVGKINNSLITSEVIARGGPRGGFTYVDIDGNGYGTVQLGTQLWMTSNLRVSRLNDGTAITKTANADMGSSSVPSYTYYNNDSALENPNGKLYNRHAVLTGKLCPTDWHVPSEDDFLVLRDYIDSINGNDNLNNDGHLLKSTKGWLRDPARIASRPTNKSDFTAQPAGFVNFGGSALGLGENTFFWTSTEITATVNAYFQLENTSDQFIWNRASGSNQAFSVRCIKD